MAGGRDRKRQRSSADDVSGGSSYRAGTAWEFRKAGKGWEGALEDEKCEEAFIRAQRERAELEEAEKEAHAEAQAAARRRREEMEDRSVNVPTAAGAARKPASLAAAAPTPRHTDATGAERLRKIRESLQKRSGAKRPAEDAAGAARKRPAEDAAGAARKRPALTIDSMVLSCSEAQRAELLRNLRVLAKVSAQRRETLRGLDKLRRFFEEAGSLVAACSEAVAVALSIAADLLGGPDSEAAAWLSSAGSAVVTLATASRASAAGQQAEVVLARVAQLRK
eukprot:TRINITY_DN4497_c0_g1_i1.p1 TRINITY_DN4497_c0_g1~~TRINITY_DN4497_c0_g1_i1.p1  ORF type:complete len:301 (+),score=140.36 TRINITY_DN4497_c0_g1_i1:64-903(+)